MALFSTKPNNKLNMEFDLVSHCMSIHLISDTVLRHLSNQDLLNTALLSKLWNRISRKYIRDKRKCAAQIRGVHSCVELRRFATFLDSTIALPDLPYNGLAIRVTKLGDKACNQDITMTTLRLFFQAQFQLKYLKIHWERMSGCIIEQFLKDIFTNGGDLQNLTLVKIPDSVGSLQKLFGGYTPNLPNLKLVKISDVQNHGVIHELISAAPEVKKIVGTVCIEQLQGFMKEGKAPFITDFEFYPKPENINLCLQLAKSKPELQSLAVLADNYFPRGNIQPFAETLFTLVASSAPCLKILNIDQINLIMLSDNNVAPFPCLQNLQLGFGDIMDEEEGYLSLSRINYGRLFPNLEKVDIDKEIVSTELLNMYRTCSFWNRDTQAQMYTCSVPELHINHSHLWSPDVFKSFAIVFPEVKKLHIEFNHSLKDFIGLLWTNWPEVENITLETKDACLLSNFDPDFSGISLDEATMLYKHNSSFLTKFQYAAAQPCITNLKNLKKIRFNIQNAHSKCRHRYAKHSFLSGMTGQLALSRMPNLNFELNRTSCLRNIRCGLVQQSLLPFITFVEASDK